MRFSNHEWKKSKLSTYAEKITKKNRENIITNVVCNSAQGGLIKQTDFFDKAIANNENTNGYYIISCNNFVYNPRKSISAPYGPVNMYELEEIGIVSPLYLCFKVKNINYRFLLHRFKSSCWHRYIYLNGDSGARHDRVSIKDDVFMDQELMIPPTGIQAKIADFFDLINKRIETQNKIINTLESQINSIRKHIVGLVSTYECQKIIELEKLNLVTLKRGNVIPKHEYDEKNIYPVYSSSTHNNGLMGYSSEFMFDEELITWSVDGGGNFFYRPKHKFNVTNVSGIFKVATDTFNYRFISEILIFQHSKQIFDYQTKAHPSVIEKLYSIPIIPIEEQEIYAKIFDTLYRKLSIEQAILKKYKEQKMFLLSNMFI